VKSVVAQLREKGSVTRLRRAPAVADAASAATVRRAGKLLRVLAQHLLDGRQAISRLGKSGRHVAVVVFAMALLSFADSSP
jgi:hypothetical protein